MSRSVLVVAAHPDDEILGCGATMARHARAGDKVHVLILAEGITSRTQHPNRASKARELSELSKHAERANAVLGVASLTLHDFPDNRMDSLDLLDVIKVVEEHIGKRNPQVVYTHHAGDVNIDHRRVHEAIVASCRPQPGHPVEEVLYFEVASSTEWQTTGSAPAFVPNWFVDVSETLELKLKALGHYKGEMRPWPHARSLRAVEHLARWRGASIGREAAEAFMLGRKLTR